MSQAKTQMVKSSFGGHLSPIVHGGSSSSASSTPSHADEDALVMSYAAQFGLQQNIHLYQSHQNWPVQKNSNHENLSSTSSSSSSNEPSIMLGDLLKNTSAAQSSLNEQQQQHHQRNTDMAEWSPFSSMAQQASESGGQWSQSANAWHNAADSNGEFAADWSGKKPQQVPPQAQSKSWAKIVSQQSSPSTNGSTTNQKNELSHEWDIKVNQTVPWNLDHSASSNQAQQQQAQTVVPSSSTSSAASSSSSSTSSISSNDKLLNNLIQFKQDQGTGIWLGNSNKTLWEQKETSETSWSPNQQAPQWNSSGWSGESSWSTDQALVQHQQQQQQIMSKIEPTGWEDPDFKQNKKSDDGTAIWGDPEQAKMAKIQKWSYGTKHVPNPATIKPESEFSNQWKGQSQPPSSSSSSSWNNTPAAPVLNDVISSELKCNSEWNSDLVDTKSWLKENKNELEWDQGRVDTSSWGINLPSTKNNFDPSIGVVDTSKWSSGNQVANPASQMTAAKPSSQSNTPGLLSMPSSGGPTSQDWNTTIFRDEETRKLSRMNSHPSSGNLLSQNRANKMPLNFNVNQAPAPAVASTNALLGNNLSQTQLFESYQLAVQSKLISPDLLNNKLPSDVLALLNQLFQTLNLYTNSINRINNLNKRCAHLNPQQYKNELDMLKQESQTHKDNLLVYQKKIDAAHMLLKQQQQQQQQHQQQQQFTGGSNLMANLTAGDVSGIGALGELPSMLKENQSQSKLMQLIQEQKMAQLGAQKPINRQNQVNKMSNSLFGNSPTPVSQWTGFNSFMSEHQAQIDDRITPFVPGKPWAGHGQPSIEDDPNCTPGSFSKPLLSETIDPESILSNLTRANGWSNPTDYLASNQNSLLGLNNNRFAQRNTWNTQNSLNSSMGSASGTIGEQIWGVRNNSSRNGMNANSPSNMNSRTLGQFNPLINQQQQQQQFFRSNSWNIGPQSTSSFNNPSQLSINSGHYLLIRNVTPQIDQSTLKALCAQHAIGQLTYFKYIPNKSCVIVRYNTKEETNIAHAKLNSISLGNTTINTQLISENDLKYELL